MGGSESKQSAPKSSTPEIVTVKAKVDSSLEEDVNIAALKRLPKFLPLLEQFYDQKWGDAFVSSQQVNRTADDSKSTKELVGMTSEPVQTLCTVLHTHYTEALKPIFLKQEHLRQRLISVEKDAKTLIPTMQKHLNEQRQITQIYKNNTQPLLKKTKVLTEQMQNILDKTRKIESYLNETFGEEEEGHPQESFVAVLDSLRNKDRTKGPNWGLMGPEEDLSYRDVPASPEQIRGALELDSSSSIREPTSNSNPNERVEEEEGEREEETTRPQKNLESSFEAEHTAEKN